LGRFKSPTYCIYRLMVIFLLWKEIRDFHVKQNIGNMNDVYLFKQSMKVLWYTKESLKAINTDNKQDLEENIGNIQALLQTLKIETLFDFLRKIYTGFQKNPEFLEIKYFKKWYKEFVQSLNNLEEVKNTKDLYNWKENLQDIENIIGFVELPEIQSDSILQSNVESLLSNIEQVFEPILFEYARKDINSIHNLIESTIGF